MSRHTLYAVEVDSDVLGGIHQQQIQPNIEVRGEPSNGEVYVRFQSIVGEDPKLPFATRNIAAALALIGVSGVDISTLTAGLSFYAQKIADGGSRATGTVHRKYTVVKGIVVPRQLSCDHRGDYSLSYEALASWDGTNDPVVETDLVALPTAPVDIERYSLGAVTIGGITIADLSAIQIDFGIDAVQEGSDSDIFPRESWIKTIQPKITFRGNNIEHLKSTAIPRDGIAATHADTSIILKKRAPGGRFAGSGDITLTAAGLGWVDTPFDAQSSDPATDAITLACEFDGTNSPIKVT